MHSTSKKKKAELLHRAGNLTEAKKLYETYLHDHPNDDDVFHALGILLAQSNDFTSALPYFEKAIALNPNQASYHNSLGNTYHQLKNIDDAIKSYQKSIKINPNYAIAYNNLGNMFYKQEKWVAAKQMYEKAIHLKENYTDAQRNFILACYHLGVSQFNMRDFDNAKMQFESILLHDYKHPEANQYLGNIFLELQDHEKAMTYYFKQLEYNPLFETYYNLGYLFMAKDRFKDAVSYFEKATELDPSDIATQLNLGSLYLKGDQIEKAILHYQKAATLKPNDPEIQHILSALTGENTSNTAPAAYVTHLFDQYAPYYDKHLTDVLKYDTPQKIIDALKLEYPHLHDEKWHIADLGCGTGLCGPLLKPFANRLVGVDLSQHMLNYAAEKSCYDELIAEDITTALTRFSSLDLIIATDVFTYIGDLDAVFHNAHHALKKEGLFVFTVEKSNQADFILQSTIRYAHSKTYLDALIKKHQFQVVRFENMVLRKQKNEPVEGYLVLLSI